MHGTLFPTIPAPDLLIMKMSPQEREELAYSLLETLPRTRLAHIRKRIDPLLQLDIVGLLPNEVALEVLSYVPWQTLLKSSLVSRRWYALSNDTLLWKRLCRFRGCDWKQPARHFSITSSLSSDLGGDADDEGMGDEEYIIMGQESDSGFMSMDVDDSISSTTATPRFILASLFPNIFATPQISQRLSPGNRRSGPSVPTPLLTHHPNYKLLHLTHTRLYNRFLYGSYRLSILQTRPLGFTAVTVAPNSPHTNTIYCLQLYTYQNTGIQTLFTGSRDKSVREWNISTSQVIRIVQGVHSSSVLSICVDRNLLVSAGSDRRVGVWELNKSELLRSIQDHTDSVLAVRFDERRLVSCSKDRTLRTYLFPRLNPHLVLQGHRAAVNAVCISGDIIVSASGDRSVRVWDANTGELMKVFEDHHSRGIAAIDVKYPFILSGSSDRHIRIVNLNTGTGWSTNRDFDTPALDNPSSPDIPKAEIDRDEDYCPSLDMGFCSSCGTEVSSVGLVDQLGGAENRGRVNKSKRYSSAHNDLVRSVVLGDNWVASGSYDSSVKIWNRRTGAFVADLSGGHTGRVFCVGLDCTKVVSVGEDQRICIWDFAHGIDTSFIQL